MATGIELSGPKPETVKALRDALIAVLATACGDAVKIAAVESLTKVAKIDHVTIANNSITVGSGSRR